MRTTSGPATLHDATHTFEIGTAGGLHEKSEDEDVRYLSTTAGLVPPLPHSHRALRHEKGVARQGLSPRLLREGLPRKQGELATDSTDLADLNPLNPWNPWLILLLRSAE